MKIFNKTLSISALFIAIILGLTGPTNALAATSPTLGTAGSYSVLGHTTVTNTGGTTMPGDLGISIGGAPTGFPPGSVGPPGTIRNAGDSLAAQNANTAAFLALSATPNVACSGQDYGAVTQELEGLTLNPGVYCANAFQLSGTLNLDAQGDPNAVWIFRSELSTLNTSTGETNNANVQFVEGVGSPCNVWWKVASSATIGTGTTFVGNILALTSISLATGASLNGRALAQTGAVTLDTNAITGSACLTASTFVGSSTVLSPVSSISPTTPTIVPKLPNTGANNSTPWESIVILSSIFMASMLVAITQRKKTT